MVAAAAAVVIVNRVVEVAAAVAVVVAGVRGLADPAVPADQKDLIVCDHLGCPHVPKYYLSKTYH